MVSSKIFTAHRGHFVCIVAFLEFCSWSDLVRSLLGTWHCHNVQWLQGSDTSNTSQGAFQEFIFLGTVLKWPMCFEKREFFWVWTNSFGHACLCRTMKDRLGALTEKLLKSQWLDSRQFVWTGLLEKLQFWFRLSVQMKELCSGFGGF